MYSRGPDISLSSPFLERKWPIVDTIRNKERVVEEVKIDLNWVDDDMKWNRRAWRIHWTRFVTSEKWSLLLHYLLYCTYSFLSNRFHFTPDTSRLTNTLISFYSFSPFIILTSIFSCSIETIEEWLQSSQWKRLRWSHLIGNESLNGIG